MKIIPLFVASSLVLTTALADQPILNESQVVEMAKIIGKKFKADQNFVFEKPNYAEKSGVWSITPRGATSAGSHFLELRDKDQYFRVGFMGNIGFSPKGSEKFRLPPDFKPQFKKIVGDKAK